jgi:hypothetical protein
MAQMAQRELTRLEQLRFAEEAARIRYGNGRPTPFPPETLFEARRSVDIGDDLWRVYNVHERLMQGGDSGRSTRGRSLRSRAIRENVRINTDLWQLPWRGWSTGSFCIFEHARFEIFRPSTHTAYMLAWCFWMRYILFIM